MTLSTEQLDTLRNLSRKKAGDIVGWISIAQARELTDLGLAARNRSGWEITAQGEVELEQMGGAAVVEESTVTRLPFQPRDLAGTP